MEIKSIDVSSYQGKPDWAKVKKAGINFAILRIHQKNGPDTSFEHNYKGCRANKIAVGGYKYSYALTEAQALKEAEETLAVLDGRELDLPVFYDLEWEKQRKLGKEAVEKIAVVFLDHIKKAGYRVGIYCNVDWYQNVLSTKLKSYDLWLARYPANDDGTVQTRLKPEQGIGWQYSSKGKVAGISGNVDMDLFYKDYKEKAEENLIVALENSTFTLKEKIEFHKKKWLKEHIFDIVLCIIVWLVVIVALKLQNAEGYLIGTISGILAVFFYVVRYNQMMIYVEDRVYKKIEK